MRGLGRAKAALETLSTVLVMVAASGLIWTLFFKQQPAAADAPPPLISDVKETIPAKYLTNVEGSGQFAIVEFSDFQCPFCAKHAKETVPELKRQLQGKARYIVVNLPLQMHPQAVPAAEAAECAAQQGKYWEMHAVLFAKQQELATGNYGAYAQSLGLNTEQFDSCLADDTALAKVKADQELAGRLGAKSTPTTFLGVFREDGGVELRKQINGALPAEAFLEEAKKLQLRGGGA
jgi:protein-disulfide isomerase